MKSIALRTLTFPTPQAFLAAYQGDHLPACLLLDLRMPGMSGIDLFTELKRRGSRMPAIIMTGHGDVSVAVRAMKVGVFDFMVVTGKLNKLIAAELELSTRTVELHRARVMEKMQAKTFSDLVRMAIALQAEERSP
jgi:two-component system response regulator FixJ